MRNLLMVFICIFLINICFAQQNSQNLSWEEKVSTEHVYKLPEKEKTIEMDKFNSVQRQMNQDPYEQLLINRDELRMLVSNYEKMEQNEKNKLYLEKYRASLKHIESQIQNYKSPSRKQKASN